MAAPLAGETILILGSGSVALFALTFARAFGVRTIIVTSSPAKAARLRELGADHTIDYHESPDWQVVVRELTDGRGVDRVVELGGAATLGRSIAAVALSGRIALVGALGGAAQIAASALAGNVYSLERISLGSRAHFEAMNRSVAQHELRPVIDRVYPFDEAPAAFADLIERERVGKVVIRVAV
jgi:NADPH:quinone reductase-like Zn-dependent oxidoreductase